MLVGVDGPDAAGKTTLADALGVGLRASVDGFHRPRADRAADDSPEGYLERAFDVEALRDRLLLPFRAGAPRVVVQVHDLEADAGRVRVVEVPARAVLVVDGVLLQRAELRGLWDLVVWLEVPPEVSLARGLARDGAALEERYRRRYLPAQALYRERERPHERADVVLDATDLDALLR